MADALLDVVGRLPWWAGVALALASYLVLGAVASRPVAVTGATQQLGSQVTSMVWKSLAAAAQVIVPLVCLAGAGVSAWRQHQRGRLLSQTVQSPAADRLHGLTWQRFEMLVGEAFRRQGYTVLETGGGGPDGGVDMVLSRPARNGSEKVLVQCKHWRAFKVGVDVVRELYGVMAARGAAAGIVVTSGRFTDEARAFAEGRNVKLVDGPLLQRLLASAAGSAPPAPAPAARATSVPSCPSCSQPMVKRTAGRGGRAGQSFWGCEGYPRCRGTRPID